MAKFDIKKLIDSHTTDGEVDYTKINEELEQQNRNIVVKEANKEIDKIKNETLATLVKGIGIDGETIDDVKLYIKTLGGSTDEVKEAKLKLEAQFKELEDKYNKEVESRSQLENQAKEEKQLALIKGLGITDEKLIKFYKWDFNSKVTDDKTFEQVVEEYAKENDVKTSTKFIKDQFGASGNETGIDISDAWNSQRNRKRK